jgi:hypothetical protein
MNNEAETKVRARVAHSVELRSMTSETEGSAPPPQNGFHERYISKDGSQMTHAMSPTNWQEDAVSTFFNDYVLPSDMMKESLHPFLSGLCRRPISCLHLSEALHATAFASQGNQLGLRWMVTEGSLAYNRALPLFSKALQDDEACKEDTTLATSFLLGLFEVNLSRLLLLCFTLMADA